MKKILIGLFMLLVTSVAFADVWENSEKIIEDFWSKGTVVKVIKDKSNISYFNKSFIQYIEIDDDELKLQCYPTQKSAVGLGSWSNDNSIEFKITKCDIKSDENGNIIIQVKK